MYHVFYSMLSSKNKPLMLNLIHEILDMLSKVSKKALYCPHRSKFAEAVSRNYCNCHSGMCLSNAGK